MSSHKVKQIGIVGLGSIGRRHFRILKKMRPDIDVVLLRSGKGKSWPEEKMASCTVTSVHEAVSSGIGAAIIASPALYHVRQAMELITSRVPLLIEKPLSHDMNRVGDLARMANKMGVLVLVGYVLRYSESLQYFREMVMSKRAGSPLFVNIECGSYLPDWRPEQDYRSTASAKAELGGGVLLELSHELDYANELFGPFESVLAVVKNSGSLDIDVEDISKMTITTKSGYAVSIHLDFCRRDIARHCSFHGTEGTLIWDGIVNTVTWKSSRGETEQKKFDIERDVMFEDQLKHFLACVEQGESPKVPLEDGISALKLIDAARQSDAEGRSVLL